MRYSKNEKYILFDNDDDFFQFALDPTPKVRRMDETHCYYDFDFTNYYNEALNNNKFFVILDENSKITKHDAISYHLVTKRVKNLIPVYLYDERDI